MKADAIGLLMFIDTIIYRLVDYVYDIFNALAKVNIFDMNDYKTIVSRIYVILGIIFLKFGGDFVVDNASKIAGTLGMSEKMVSVTIIAIATSLPELITSIVATTKGKVDMAIGNIIGSCILNMIFIMGVSAIIKPIEYSVSYNMDFLILIVATALLCLFPIIGKKNEMTRLQGSVFLLSYIVYMCITIWA